MADTKIASDLDLLTTTITSLSYLLIRCSMAGLYSNRFYTDATSALERFTSEEMVESHLNDRQFFINLYQEKYKVYKKDENNNFIYKDGKKVVDHYNTTARNADVEAAVKGWLGEQQKAFAKLIPPFENPFSEYYDSIKKIKEALVNVQKAISDYDETTYDLEEVVKTIPGYVVGGVSFEYNDEIAAQLGIGSIPIISFVDTSGGEHDVDETVNAALATVRATTEAVVSAARNNPELITSGVVATEIEAAGAFIAGAAASGYVTSRETPEEIWTGAYPGREYDSEIVREENIEYYARVFGLSPEEVARMLGEDTDSAYLGAAVIAPTLLAVASFADDPEHSFLSGEETSKILEAYGSNKTIEEIREDNREYMEELLAGSGIELAAALGTKPAQGTQLSTQLGLTQSSTTDILSTIGTSAPIDYSTAAIVDTSGRLNTSVEASISELISPTTSIDTMALNEYYGKMQSVEADRAGLLSTYEDAYSGVNVDKFKDLLSKGGYSEKDINYILEHKEIGFTALVTATQASALSDISSSIASQQGIAGFDTAHDDGLKLEDLLNGKAQAKLGVEMDPDVTSARTKVNEIRSNYNSSVQKANASVKQANDDKAALDKIRERIIKKSGTDTSNWSDEDVKEYNEAVTKYNNSNAQANEDVEAANKLKGELDKFESEFEELKDKKYEELLKDYQETVGTQDQPTAGDEPQPVTEPGAEIPGEEYSGDDSTILATVTGGEDGLTVGDGEQTLGATVVTSESTSSGDEAILSGLNLGDGGLSIGAPDSGTTVGIEPPTSPQPVAQPSQNVDVQGVNNVQVNETAFTDERVLPDLGLSIDMNTITGGSKKVDIPVIGAVTNASDTSIINSLNITEHGLGNGESASLSATVPVDAPAINTMASPEFEKQIRKELTTDDVNTAVRESSNSQKIDTSRFVEPPSSTQEVQGVTKEPSTKTELENGIVIELGEDGSLRL
jgi:hypothetical protein